MTCSSLIVGIIFMEWIFVNAEMPCQFLLEESNDESLLFPPYLLALSPIEGSEHLQHVTKMDVV